MKKIFIYSGDGIGRVSLLQATRMFESVASVEWIEAKDVRRGLWKKDASLFAVPGGADLPFCRDLAGEGNCQISSFIHEGGAYLGICAGAYYAGSFVEFDKGGELEVLGERELAFFPGTVQGPAFPPFQYKSGIGSKAIGLSIGDEKMHCFYQGGGVFCRAEEFSSVEVLARYADTGGAAIVLCQVGRGVALLSGVHFEYAPEAVEDKAIAQVLHQHESGRHRLIKSLIQNLLEDRVQSN